MAYDSMVLTMGGKNMKKYLLWSLIFSFTGIQVFCVEKIVNGSKALWNKRYNDVAYAATHNGSSHMACPVQNQDMPIAQQLKCGIRATKVHVWNARGSNGESVPYVCHGITQDLFEGPYLDQVIDKVPSLFRGWARDVLKQMEPVNELVRDAFKAAYGDGKKPGVIQFNHCIFDPSRKQLVGTLKEIKNFLQDHKNEVFTLILEDHTNDLAKIALDFQSSDILPYVHAQDISKPWPTLGDMVETNKRLVVLVHGDESLDYSKYPWMHNIWNFAWDTEWNFSDLSALKDESKDIVPKRGQQSFANRALGPKNKLFMMHHFVTPSTGGCKKSAKKVNHKSFLTARVNRLKGVAGQIPNFIQVDFFQYPNSDIFDVVNALNGQA